MMHIMLEWLAGIGMKEMRPRRLSGVVNAVVVEANSR